MRLIPVRTSTRSRRSHPRARGARTACAPAAGGSTSGCAWPAATSAAATAPRTVTPPPTGTTTRPSADPLLRTGRGLVVVLSRRALLRGRQRPALAFTSLSEGTRHGTVQGDPRRAANRPGVRRTVSAVDPVERRPGGDAVELRRVAVVGGAGRGPVPPRRSAGTTRRRRGPRRRRAAARHPPRRDEVRRQ